MAASLFGDVLGAVVDFRTLAADEAAAKPAPNELKASYSTSG